MKTKEKGGCGCQTPEKINEGLKKDAEQIVKDMEGYSKADHDKKRREIVAAFDKEKS